MASYAIGCICNYKNIVMRFLKEDSQYKEQRISIEYSLWVKMKEDKNMDTSTMIASSSLALEQQGRVWKRKGRAVGKGVITGKAGAMLGEGDGGKAIAVPSGRGEPEGRRG